MASICSASSASEPPVSQRSWSAAFSRATIGLLLLRAETASVSSTPNSAYRPSARAASAVSAVTCRMGGSRAVEPGGTQASAFWRSSRRARSPLSTRATAAGSAGWLRARTVASSRESSSSASVSLCASAFCTVGPGRTHSPRPRCMVP
ncbi:hypothetical protein D9M68_714940 [compost metagenome]